jgi:hypothetical protein
MSWRAKAIGSRDIAGGLYLRMRGGPDLRRD